MYLQGFIFGYINLKKKKVKIFLNKFLNLKIILFSKPSQIFLISFYNIKSLISKNKTILYLFCTDYGLILNIEILKKKIGGILLCSFI
jgi:hypothetical protein